jgi:glycosyltransferase involved in cell wall biosynthesis
LEKTLKSIFSQKYLNLEVIIQDGGSADGSVEIIRRYAKKHKSINWVSQKDGGQLDAINTGLKKANGDVLTYINADDIYKSGTLAEVGEIFKNNPETLWLVGRGDIIDDKENITNKWVTFYKNSLLDLNKYSLLLAVNYITQPSTFISKKAYKRYGPFTGTKNYIMEYEMWLKLGKVEMPTLTNKYLSSFRLIPGTISSTSFNTLLKIDYEIAEKYTKNPLLLMIHKLNNLGRVFLANFI